MELITSYIERECNRREFVISRWNRREQERITKENEGKRLAGIATVAQLSETEKMQKLKARQQMIGLNMFESVTGSCQLKTQ